MTNETRNTVMAIVVTISGIATVLGYAIHADNMERLEEKKMAAQKNRDEREWRAACRDHGGQPIFSCPGVCVKEFADMSEDAP